MSLYQCKLTRHDVVKIGKRAMVVLVEQVIELPFAPVPGLRIDLGSADENKCGDLALFCPAADDDFYWAVSERRFEIEDTNGVTGVIFSTEDELRSEYAAYGWKILRLVPKEN